MIEGLKLTFSGEELRTLLEARVGHHERCADRWDRERQRTPEEQSEDSPLLPESMCENESERHVWRAAVLRFIRDHLEPGETYRLCATDLGVAELLPAMPEPLEQDAYEERNRVGFNLERLAKAAERLVVTTPGHWCPSRDAMRDDGRGEDTDGFTATRLDADGGPEIVLIERT